MKKIEDTNKKLFGEYAVAVSGFDKHEKEKILDVASEMPSFLKVVFIDDTLEKKTLSEIFSTEHKYGFLYEANAKKAVIMSGFLEKDIVPFMRAIRASGILCNVWAVLTPTSNKWKFTDLINELENEAKELAKLQKKQIRHKK